MAAFDDALNFVLSQEGGWNPNDPSFRGILQSTYDAYRRGHGLPTQDVRRISDAELTAIYDVEYWQASGAGDLAANGQPGLALAVFDGAVNQGTPTAKRLLAQSGGDLATFLSLREARYRATAAADPAHAADLSGWLARLGDVQREAGMLAASQPLPGEGTPPAGAQSAGLGGPLGIVLALGLVGALFFRGTLRGFLR